MTTGLARPKEFTPAEQLAESAGILLGKNGEAIRKIEAEGGELFKRVQDPQRTFLAEANPFLGNGRSAEGIDNDAMRFSDIWQLRTEPRLPDSAQELMMATFAPGIGSVDKVATVLERAGYPRSLAALRVIEEELKEIFVTTEKDPEMVPRAISRGVSNLRQLIAFLLLKAAGWAAKSPEMVAAGTRAMIANSSPLLLIDDSEAPRYADAPMEYPSNETRLLQNILEGKQRGKKDMVELHHRLKELTPLFEAFRIVLADEIRVKEGQEKAVMGAENVFKPLATKHGLILALSQSVGLTTSSIFGVLPHILDKNIDDLEEIDGLNRDGVKLEDVKSMGTLSCNTPGGNSQLFARFELCPNPLNFVSLRVVELGSAFFHSRNLEILTLGQAKMAGIYGETTNCVKDRHGLLVYNYMQHTYWVSLNGEVFRRLIRVNNHAPGSGPISDSGTRPDCGEIGIVPLTAPLRKIGMLAADYDEVQVLPLAEKIEVKIGGKCYAVLHGRPSESIF